MHENWESSGAPRPAEGNEVGPRKPKATPQDIPLVMAGEVPGTLEFSQQRDPW